MDAFDLRRQAAKCRKLADFTVSRNDAAVLRRSAEDFDHQADELDSGDARSGSQNQASAPGLFEERG